MKILAFDSTAKAASVAVCDGEKLLAEFTINNGNTHSETLLPMKQQKGHIVSVRQFPQISVLQAQKNWQRI